MNAQVLLYDTLTSVLCDYICSRYNMPCDTRAGVRLWRAAVLAAIQRQRPGDAQALSIAHHHFGCTREMAADLHARAQARMPSSGTHRKIL